MRDISHYKRYIKEFNGFQINMIKPLTKLTSTQLASKLEIAYKSLVRIQNQDLWAPMSLEAKTYKNFCSLVKECNLTFPDSQTAVLSIARLNDKPVILSGFQYKVAIHLLYKRNHHLNTSKVSFLDTYFHQLKNYELLENCTALLDLVVKLREIFEQKGLSFPNAYTIKLCEGGITPVLTRIELENIFKSYLHNLIELEFKNIELLEHLIFLFRQEKEKNREEESLKVDYKYLISVSNFSSITTLRQNLAELEKLGFLTREIRAIKEGGILQVAYIKLNWSNIATLQQILPASNLTI